MRQLNNGLHKDLQTLTLTLQGTRCQGRSHRLHFLGQQRCTVELYHLQSTVNLVQVAQAELQPAFILGILYIGFQRLLCLLQSFFNFPFHPLQSDVILAHRLALSRSEFVFFRIKADTRLLCTCSSSGCW